MEMGIGTRRIAKRDRTIVGDFPLQAIARTFLTLAADRPARRPNWFMPFWKLCGADFGRNVEIPNANPDCLIGERRPAMNMSMQNLRYALRLLRKKVGFTLVTVITLALGIGANTAIFSVIYPALLRKLPYRQAENLVTLGESRAPVCCGFAASYPDFEDWKKFAKSFDSLGGFFKEDFTMTGAGEPKHVTAVMVTPDFLSTLGVTPVLGRDFTEEEVLRDPAGPTVAILSYAFWQTDFGGDPGVLSRNIRLGNNAVTIIGVLPRNFEFAPASSPSIWVPLHLNEYYATARNFRWLQVAGRLAPGVSFDQSLAEMRNVTAQLA